MKIYVDADASPVKDVVVSIAENEDLSVVLVKSFNHFSHDEEKGHVETIYVDTGADSADYRIMKMARKDDIIITQDYGLASLGLGKGCIVLHHKGFRYTNDNIDRLLQTRHVSAKARRSGYKTKGPKPFTGEDQRKFEYLLKKTISEMKKEGVSDDQS
ncbi:YaiI/YqxD family protein [Ornithinibacillus halophilus]|uniref:UPF0178 protein SAMN05216225_10036 n=1 Tax=Ornithinibacillus halophilus TaxID=930117 RepID=A0A1M5DTX4_9BACI|nr:YaiI/YqxD family protein [Ornithinibacillus halophilus]SHF70478.1 hypothetical protein SAMN05216225_10036 [Ornithinibacillus halophilus]